MLKLMSVLVLCAAHAASELQKPAEWTRRASVATGLEEKTLDRHRDLSLAFVTNTGRIEPRVRFDAHSDGAAFYFTPTEAVFAFAKGNKGHRLRLTFPGANPAPRLVGHTPAAGTINELIGPAAHWRTGLRAYEEIIYRDLWPGVDLAFRGENGALKYEFYLAPGANAADIRLSYSGADRLDLDASGDLRIHTALGILRDTRPESFQTVHGKRVPVASRYALVDGGYQFALGAYDPKLPLVIDPGLEYSTFLGSSRTGVGSAFDQGTAIAVDESGAAYVTGIANGPDFPISADAVDTTVGTSGNDAFLTKLNPAGSAILYSTYLGGSSGDTGTGVATDGLGNAYIVGVTTSLDFPIAPGAIDSGLTGSSDAFIAKLSIESVPVPATLTLTSASSSNPVGATQTLTASVRDANSQPVGGVIVHFAVAGAVTTSGECTTDSTGTCDFSYQGPTAPGTDAVTAFADMDRDRIQVSHWRRRRTHGLSVLRRR